VKVLVVEANLMIPAETALKVVVMTYPLFATGALIAKKLLERQGVESSISRE
jgi:hypothetical protein